MRPSVAAAWPAMCSTFEGRCWWMYLDTKKLVTTGLGILLETVEEAQSFPWFRVAGGADASADEIAAEYKRVKTLTEFAKFSGFHSAFKGSAKLRLPESEIDKALMETTARFWAEFQEVHPDVDDWPADAQLAIMDLMWQNGPKFTEKKETGGYVWKNMRAALFAGDWAGAAEAVPGTHKRAMVRKRLFGNAEIVKDEGLDFETLWNTAKPAKPAPPVEPPPPVEPTGDPITDMIASLPLKHSKTPAADYVTYQGEHVLPLDLEIVLRCAAAVGWGPVTFIKGGLEPGGLSARTHAWLAAGDIRTRDHRTAKVWDLTAALIRSGIVGFPRGYPLNNPVDSFDPHIHFASREAGKLAHISLRAQIAEFLDGGDGLVGSKEYHGPSVRLGTWAQSPYNPANITADTGMYRVVTADGDDLLGLDVDRKIRTRVKNGTVIQAARRVQRWDRQNVVVDDGTVNGLWFAAQFLEPVEAVPEVVNPEEN